MQDFFKSIFSSRQKFKDEEETAQEKELDYLCKTDQAMHFLEYEIDTYIQFVPEALRICGVEDTNLLESLKEKYRSALNALILDDLGLSSRTEEYIRLRNEYLAGGKNSRKQLATNIVSIKKDIQAKLRTRAIHDSDRNQVLRVLRPLITRIKLLKLNRANSDPSPSDPGGLGDFTVSSSRSETPQPDQEILFRNKTRKYSVDEIQSILSASF